MNLAFVYQGVEVTFDEKKLINLTQMWRAAGSPESKDPREWRRRKGKEFIADLARSLDVAPCHIARSTKGGKGGGGETFGHWQIAVAYAKDLSHEYHRYVNEAFKEWAEEKADPGLKLERAVEGYRKKGKSESWIENRFKAIGTRKAMTDKMRDHNCVVRGHDNPYLEITRAIALRITGKPPAVTRKEAGMSKGKSTRDAYSESELSSIEWAENQTRLLIEKRGAEGNAECVQAGRDAAKAIRLAMEALEAL